MLPLGCLPIWGRERGGVTIVICYLSEINGTVVMAKQAGRGPLAICYVSRIEQHYLIALKSLASLSCHNPISYYIPA